MNRKPMSSCTVHKLNHKYKAHGSRALSLSDLRVKFREGHYNLDYPKFAGVKEDAVTLKVGCGQVDEILVRLELPEIRRFPSIENYSFKTLSRNSSPQMLSQPPM